MMYGFYDGWSFFLPGVFWLLVWILFWIAVPILVLNRWSGRRRNEWHTDDPSEPPALEILKARYARGEISKEEYEEKKKDLL